jgi:tryptophan synthase alpha chain
MHRDECVPVMAHLVAGFPDLGRSAEAARALAAGGASYLEIQFPFSDPSADGPSIQDACSAALRAGFRTADGFSLVRKAVFATGLPVFIMSYANILYSRGIERFTEEAAMAGARGIIVPDLPPDYDEGLYAAGRRAGIAVVPVVAPGITDERIALTASVRPEYLYVALRTGITGGYTDITGENRAFLERVGTAAPVTMGGFGIRTAVQVAALGEHVDVVVAGSVFVDVIRLRSVGSDHTVFSELERTARELTVVPRPARKLRAIGKKP